MSAGSPPQDDVRRILRTALAAAVLCCLAKLATLGFTHLETDELIYWSVARRMLEDGHYTLRGSPLLQALSPHIYDRPLFHHPPLYPWLLSPFVIAMAPGPAVVISWLGHVLCIAAVALFAMAQLRRGGPETAQLSRFAWLPLVAVAADPVLSFVSRKLWIDSLVTGLSAFSFALVTLAVQLTARRRTLWLALAGVTLGLAGLAKLPGLLVAPLMAACIFAAPGAQRRRALDLALVAVPSVVMVTPWLAWFYGTYHTLTPHWLRPDDFALRNFPFVAEAVARPWYYYVWKLLQVQPLFLLVFALALLPLGSGAGWSRRLPVVWGLGILAVTTAQGVDGYGFQMRYTAPAMPALYMALLAEPRAQRLAQTGAVRALFFVCIAYAAACSAVYLSSPTHDELYSLPELLHAM